MRVDPKDGVCRSCSWPIEVIDADDASMTVSCTNEECLDTYLVEPDAFGDGAMTYYVGFFTGQYPDASRHDQENSSDE